MRTSVLTNRNGGATIDESKESKEKFQRYGYIGYLQDFPLDRKHYTLQIDLLLKLARDAIQRKDFYKAIRYLNVVLIKNPNNTQAKYYKKEVMQILEQLKLSRNPNEQRI